MNRTRRISIGVVALLLIGTAACLSTGDATLDQATELPANAARVWRSVHRACLALRRKARAPGVRAGDWTVRVMLPSRCTGCSACEAACRQGAIAVA
jgi:ferredoxin